MPSAGVASAGASSAGVVSAGAFSAGVASAGVASAGVSSAGAPGAAALPAHPVRPVSIQTVTAIANILFLFMMILPGTAACTELLFILIAAEKCVMLHYGSPAGTGAYCFLGRRPAEGPPRSFRILPAVGSVSYGHSIRCTLFCSQSCFFTRSSSRRRASASSPPKNPTGR